MLLFFPKLKKRKKKWHELFHIINDAGHCENGLYALQANYQMNICFEDLKKFRSIESPLTGHGEAHLLPSNVYLSNGPLGSTTAQAQGLCMASHLAQNNKTTILLLSDGALMEGETKEALSAISGFFTKNKTNPLIVIVSDNNTKLSGRIDQDSFSLTPFFNSLSSQGWEYKEILKAHDVCACLETIEESFRLTEKIKKPIFIRAKTIKGYGIKETQNSSSGGHGFPLKTTDKLFVFLEEIYGNKNFPVFFKNWAEDLILKEKKLSSIKTKSSPISSLLPSTDRKKVQEGIGKALIEGRQKYNLPIVSISADLQGSTGVLPFRKKFPEYAFDVGVAESNMISTAAGFSKTGFIPIVDTFTQFGITKGALPLLMANLSQAPMIAVFSHAGLQDAADGASHQCLTYIAGTASLPNTQTYYLSSSEEALFLVRQALSNFAKARQKKQVPKTFIFFLGREVFPISYLPASFSYPLGKAQVVFSNIKAQNKKGITIWSLGSLLEEAFIAGAFLAKKNWNVKVVNASCLNDPDTDTLLSCFKETGTPHLLTIEDHYLEGGMGALLAQKLALKLIPFKMKSLAVKSLFGRSAYQAKQLYEKEGLTSSHIIKQALSFY